MGHGGNCSIGKIEFERISISKHCAELIISRFLVALLYLLYEKRRKDEVIVIRNETYLNTVLTSRSEKFVLL